jgi:hypothetical protein
VISCAQKIEILNVAGSRESKELGVYDWMLAMLRFLNRPSLERDPQKQPTSRAGEGGVGGSAAELLGQPYFRLEPVG